MKKFLAFNLCACTLYVCIFGGRGGVYISFLSFGHRRSLGGKKYIDELFDMGIMAGDNGNSRAEENITRGEFCALITRALYDVDSFDGTVDFPDVKKRTIFFYKNIGIAVQKRHYKGRRKGIF
ncbi:MAG: S-layer homology domain-containing protein [Clostridiales bacterium]|nr:MAG: S-layer homology domain-containing protein [Clostridiales bacterium]